MNSRGLALWFLLLLNPATKHLIQRHLALQRRELHTYQALLAGKGAALGVQPVKLAGSTKL